MLQPIAWNMSGISLLMFIDIVECIRIGTIRMVVVQHPSIMCMVKE
jgi:hypothetical protein